MKHTHGSASALVSALARSQAAEHRVDGRPERRARRVRIGGARDEQAALQRQAPDELHEDAGVDVHDLAALDRRRR